MSPVLNCATLSALITAPIFIIAFAGFSSCWRSGLNILRGLIALVRPGTAGKASVLWQRNSAKK